MKKKKKLSTPRKIIIIVCCVILAAAIAGVIIYFVQANRADEIYSEAVEMYTIPNDPDDDTDFGIDWDALWAVNPEVCGWVYVPAIPTISYPIIHHTDNDYYLRRSWTGEPLNAGCIMMDYHCTPDFTDFHTIIYGHNMTVGPMAGTMFGQLKKFQDQTFYDTNDNRVIIFTPAANLYYTIFSVEVVAPTDPGVYTVGDFSRDEAFDFVEHMRDVSEVDTGVWADGDDKILTLSTCSGTGSTRRLTVHCTLRKAIDMDGNDIIDTFGREIIEPTKSIEETDENTDAKDTDESKETKDSESLNVINYVDEDSIDELENEPIEEND